MICILLLLVSLVVGSGNKLVRSSEPTIATGRHLLSQSDHLDLIRRSIPQIQNKTLIVCVVVREPFVIFNQHSEWANSTALERREFESQLDNYSGVAIEVVKRLRSIFKFNIKIIRPRDNQFGVYLASARRWSGIMGELVSGQADIGVTALSITESRAHAIDFTRAYYVETVAILLRTPEEVQNYLAIFEPFSLDVWMVLLFTILLLILLITIMTKLEDNQRRQQKLHRFAKLLERQAIAAAADLTTNDQQHSTSVAQFGRRLSKLNKGGEHEFGDSWLERFYYAVTCVLNILLIRGKC